MVWFKIETHDYMDERPEIGYRLFKDDAEAKSWEDHMQKNYSGGTTHLKGYATQKEVLDFICRNNILLDPKTEENVNNINYYAL